MTTTTPHTPGPWKFTEYGVYSGKAQWIARTPSYEKSEKRTADFCLIAAAPDLLSAIKALMNRAVKDAEHYAPEGNEPIWAFIADASDAIAKAQKA
jgi:hypothetical protein